MICQECGQEGEPKELHTLNDCAIHHLKRAVEIKGLKAVTDLLICFTKEG